MRLGGTECKVDRRFALTGTLAVAEHQAEHQAWHCLPIELQAHLRPVALVEPDTRVACEATLLAGGFENAPALVLRARITDAMLAVAAARHCPRIVTGPRPLLWALRCAS